MEELKVTEYKDVRVLTTQQIAEAYGTNTDTITKNFNRNKDRYVEGKHFICLEGEDLKDFKTTGQIDLSLKINKLYLWTKKGAFLHAKSLNTDTAWEVYDRLVDSYFDHSNLLDGMSPELKAALIVDKRVTKVETELTILKMICRCSVQNQTNFPRTSDVRQWKCLVVRNQKLTGIAKYTKKCSATSIIS